MLVLTRKTNQSIMIGDEIEVTVLAVSGTSPARHHGAEGRARCSARRSTSRSRARVKAIRGADPRAEVEDALKELGS